jgi:SAM-dependent methyltransferase
MLPPEAERFYREEEAMGAPRHPGRAAALALLLAAACAVAAPPPRRPANIMSFERADWLERPGREAEDRPELVLQAMRLAPGQVVAEVGCGSGFFARRLARAVAPGGRVYAEDIQPEMLDLLRERAAKEGIGNIVPVLGTDVDPRLPRGELDWILLVDVYHEFQQPRPMLARLRESLAKGGRVALVEYRLEGETARHVRVPHRMSVAQVLAEWQPAGFELVERLETLPSQHLFIFRARR